MIEKIKKSILEFKKIDNKNRSRFFQDVKSKGDDKCLIIKIY